MLVVNLALFHSGMIYELASYWYAKEIPFSGHMVRCLLLTPDGASEVTSLELAWSVLKIIYLCRVITLVMALAIAHQTDW